MQSSDRKEVLTCVRRKAEKRFLEQSKRIRELSAFEVKYLVTELGTRQIELEMQNEKRRCAHQELASALSRYQELYEFAPVGYLTFYENGSIREVNLTEASMLGIERGLLIGRPFNQFVDSSDQDAFYLRLRMSFN